MNDSQRGTKSGHIPTGSLFSTLLIAIALLAPSTGCATLLGKQKGPLDKLDTTELKKEGYSFGAYGANKALVTEESGNSIVLEVNDGKRHFEKIPLVPGQSMFIADVIRDAELHKKIGRIRTTILRHNGPNRPPVRLDVDFDSSGNMSWKA